MSGGVTPQTKSTDTNCRMENGQTESGRISQKISQKLAKKVLTRLAESAIISIQGKGTPSLVVKKSFQKVLRNLLTNPTKCGIINTSKERRTPQTQKGLIL